MSAPDPFALEPRDFPLCLSSAQCPTPERPACRTLFDHLSGRVRGDVRATADLLAVSDTKAVVAKARAELSARTDAVAAAHAGSRAALVRFEVFLKAGAAAAARDDIIAITTEYADDGAHRRHRRLIPGRWTADALIVAAALFDTVFLGTLFRFLINADPSTPAGRLVLVVAYLPGFILAAALMLTGLWLGQAVERHRDRRDGRSGADRVPPPHWVLPLGLAALALFAVGVAAWARMRFLQSVDGDQQVLPAWVVIVLLVTLSITAIAAKVMATNSHAEELDAARRARRRANAAGTKLCAAAERAFVTHEQRWQALRESVFVVISDVEDLWAAVARHCGPDVIDLGSSPPEDPTREDFAPLVQHTPVPSPAFGPILNAGLALSQHEPSAARRELDRLRSAFVDQAAGGGR